MVVLKRLEDAIAAGDPIYGVIEASGINQDGASNGITAPNGLAQEQLITDVYRRFGIDPERISYVEAHGTGTKLGDPVEANALVRGLPPLHRQAQLLRRGQRQGEHRPHGRQRGRDRPDQDPALLAASPTAGVAPF